MSNDRSVHTREILFFLLPLFRKHYLHDTFPEDYCLGIGVGTIYMEPCMRLGEKFTARNLVKGQPFVRDQKGLYFAKGVAL